MAGQAISMTPKVSCLMVTADRPELCRRAIRCFQQQTYDNRELLVVDDGKTDLAPLLRDLPSNDVRYLKLEKTDRTLGDLRNIALDQAEGEVLVQWDDDDWYHPDRLTRQLVPILEGADASVLSGALMHLDTPEFFEHPYIGLLKNGVPGTIMHRAESTVRYPSLRRSEDTLYLREWARKKTLAQLPPQFAHLFVRCFHGANTWEVEHFLTRIRNTPRHFIAYVWHHHIRGQLHAHPRFHLDSAARASFERYVTESEELGLFTASRGQTRASASR